LRLISREAPQAFLLAKLRSGLSWKTVKHLRTVFGAVMNSAEIAELIPNNPVRKTRMPRRGKERAAIAPEKILELLEALPEPSASLVCWFPPACESVNCARCAGAVSIWTRVFCTCGKWSTTVTSMSRKLNGVNARFRWGECHRDSDSSQAGCCES